MEICPINIPLAFVTYKPEEVFYSDIGRMLEANQAIYIFCNCLNSYLIISEKFKTSSHLKVFFMGGNVGLAKAYNFLMNKLTEDGYFYFYLFDQDTKINDDFFDIKNSIVEYIDVKRHVMTQLQSIDCDRGSSAVTLTEPMFIINSGSLVNIRLLKALGGFPRDYFVDGIDYFISLAASVNGFAVGFLSGDFGLNHSLNQGDSKGFWFNGSISYRFYGWARIKDVTSSYIKLIGYSINHRKYRHGMQIVRFLLAFYLGNLLALIAKR